MPDAPKAPAERVTPERAPAPHSLPKGERPRADRAPAPDRSPNAERPAGERRPKERARADRASQPDRPSQPDRAPAPDRSPNAERPTGERQPKERAKADRASQPDRALQPDRAPAPDRSPNANRRRRGGHPTAGGGGGQGHQVAEGPRDGRPPRPDQPPPTSMRLAVPEQLPIADHVEQIQAALREHQVVVVAGETGSGKTTQLPKIALAAGRGRHGMVGHTQPRRLAARTLAARIAEECGVELGAEVGFAVRFTDRTAKGTRVKVMTDGILLAELQRDRDLRRYDTLIIDEAHERSLNVERFSAHFGGAPIIEVSGRTYPVELRYRPTEDVAADDVDAVCEAVLDCLTEGDGDVLVFLSGQREIHDVADALRPMLDATTTVLPLYARLSVAEQSQVFAPGGGRRVVLATNVAETSITVPGIRYVVDPGTARISRYSKRLKVQRLPIEPISQASANQRAGRCGRVRDGIAVRLYSEQDYLDRPAFTDPEILRTNLAAVLLQMAALRLGDVERFPFLDPPDTRQVRDGLVLLHELGALEDPPKEAAGPPRLTPLGRRLARLPLDPRLGRMVLAAAELGCVREVVVIAAGLTIQDPRERPEAERGRADAAHARFVDRRSDFLTLLNLWDHVRDTRRRTSANGLRRACREQYLNYLRIREWQDLVAQLREVLGTLDIGWSSGREDPDGIHRALLAGLLSQVGLYDELRRDYLGARGARFVMFPGSALARTHPEWVMSSELVETSRLFARRNAAIKPEWIEEAAAHLVSRSYAEPRWSARRGATVATERVTLYGIPLVTGRSVDFGRIDPALCRELFIRGALVEGEWQTRHRFWHANRAALAAAEEVEQRSRRRGLVLDDEGLFAFYDARIPPDITSVRHFDAWWKPAALERGAGRRAVAELRVRARDRRGRGDRRRAAGGPARPGPRGGARGGAGPPRRAGRGPAAQPGEGSAPRARPGTQPRAGGARGARAA